MFGIFNVVCRNRKQTAKDKKQYAQADDDVGDLHDFFAFTHGLLAIFLTSVNGERRDNGRMAKSENHHGNRDPNLMKRVLIERHLAGE